MKKIISILLISSILLSTAIMFTVSAHWADEAINKLADMKIISGDENGDFRPDSYITRAEFVKIINRYFNLTEKSEETFKDVDKNKWYYDEFLIAEKAGYILGDNGYAFPERTITRAEAAVIISRAAGILTSEAESRFSDSKEIPDWAFSSIAYLTSVKMLSGYPDGSFRPMAHITRGEAFTVIAKGDVLLNKEDKEETKTQTESSFATVVTPKPKPSGGGGGGGFSGSPVIDYNLKIPNIIRYDKDSETVYWSEVSGASSYTVKVECAAGTNTYDYPINIHSAALTSCFSELASTSDDSFMEYKVSVMANGILPYVSSAYSGEILTRKDFEALLSPELQIRTGKAGGVAHAIINWDEVTGASGYNVSVALGDTEFTSFTYSEEKREIRIPDLSLIGENTAVVSVTGVSADKSVYKNSPVSELEVVYSGAVAGAPKEIYTTEDFLAIANEPSGNYILKASIELPSDYTPFAFSGSLIGDDEVNLKSITFDTAGASSSASVPYGLFTILSGNVVIKNIRTKGSISVSGGSVGALAGSVNSLGDESVILNCINEANITATGDYAGGFFGNMPSWSGYKGKVSNLINIGNVSGAGSIGGIVGILKINIDKCANLGIVSGTTYVGGMTGRSYLNCSITNSYNTGKINGTVNYTAGIDGYCGNGNVSITNCYNTGAISGNSATKAGIICGVAANFAATVENCYSTSGLGRLDIGPSGAGMSITNCAYLSSTHTDDSADGVANTIPLTEEQLKNPEIFASYIGDSYINAESTYPYLAEYPQVVKNDIIQPEYPKNLTGSYNSGVIRFSWDAPYDYPDKIVCTIFDNTDIVPVGEYELSSTETSFELSEAEEGKYYEIAIKFIYGNKESETGIFEYKAE